MVALFPSWRLDESVVVDEVPDLTRKVEKPRGSPDVSFCNGDRDTVGVCRRNDRNDWGGHGRRYSELWTQSEIIRRDSGVTITLLL